MIVPTILSVTINTIKPIIFDRVDIPLAVQKLKTPYDIGNENNNITAVKLTNYLYECCRNSYKEKEQHIEISGNLLNCKSANFKAIADANLFTYNTLSQQKHPELICILTIGRNSKIWLGKRRIMK